MTTIPLGIAKLSRELADRVRAGEHLVLWGPRGAGKTTLLDALRARLPDVPCGVAGITRSLDDITRALEEAYPDTDTRGVARRVARARLWRAADQTPAVLLLDHACSIGTAMKGWLRRLRGGIAGIVLAVDVDSPRERLSLRPYRLGSATVRMPALPARMSAALFKREWIRRALPDVPDTEVRSLLRSARGRPGWIVACAELATNPAYWRHNSLRTAMLRTDAEMTVRGVRLRAAPEELRVDADRPRPRTRRSDIGQGAP